MNQKQVEKRYYKEFGLSMGAYVVAVIASSFTLGSGDFSKAAQIAIVLIPVIPTIFVIIAIMRALRDSDELQQRIQLSAVAFSAIITGFITFTYGFLENIGFPKLPSIWVLPMLFVFWGVSLGYFNKRYQ
ncbi:hypothetical protein MASR2M66_28430 [Chloroflexota bacterium]